MSIQTKREKSIHSKKLRRIWEDDAKRKEEKRLKPLTLFTVRDNSQYSARGEVSRRKKRK